MRRFEFRDNKSAKFWAIGLDGMVVTTNWGRIGSAGQTKAKEFADAAAAARDVDKQIASKISKGYAEVGIAPVAGETAGPVLDAASIPAERPEITVVVPMAAGMGLVLGIAADGDHVVAVGGQGRDLFYSSFDGGRTFVPRRSPGPGLRGAFVRGNDIWVCGEWGYLAHSPDRGQSWTKLSSGAQACLFGIVADRAGTLWVAGDDGFVAASRDGREFAEVEGLSESIGRLTATSDGVLIPTDDGNLYLANDDGFTDLGVRAPDGLMKAVVTPCGSTIAVGKDGIFRAPGGGSFERVDGDHSGLLCGIATFDDGRVVVVGESGQIWVSFNDGASFERVEQSFAAEYLWCCEAVYDTLLVGTHGGVVLRIGTAAERAPSPLPPLPSELGEDDDAPENPEWRAPKPSTAEQKWSPPSFDLEVRDGIFVTQKFRTMLYARRGGIDIGVRPLPTLDEAWGAFRRAIWASDRSYMEAKNQRSRIWNLASAEDPLERAVGERILDPSPREVTEEADRRLFVRVTSRYNGIVHDFADRIYTRLTDLLVASNGLVEGLRRAFHALEELPYLGVGPFGRFRDLLAVTDDETYDAARAMIVAAIADVPGETPVKRTAAMRWAATFMFPLGPAATEVEEELHEAAMREVGDYGNSRVHASGIAAGGIDTLERFLAAQKSGGAGYQFFGPFNFRMYLTSVLELEGSAAVDVFSRLKPAAPWTEDPFYNAIWCSLVGHIDSPAALETLYREYTTPPGDTWGLATLTESAQIEPERVLAFIRERGPDELIEAVEKGMRTDMPPAPVDPPDDVLFGVTGNPTHYSPPRAVRSSLTKPDWGPPTTFAWEEDARREAFAQNARNEMFTWNGQPLGSCTGDALEAFVAHREQWGLPTIVGMLSLVPHRFHERLLALGFDFGHWTTNAYLVSVLVRGGASHLPVLVGALQHANALEVALETAKSVGDMRLVPPIAAAFVGKKNKAAATSWLLRFPLHGAAGAALMLADNPKDKEAPRLLRFIASRGHRELVERMADHAGVGHEVRMLLDSDPLTAAARKKLKLPGWADAANLPNLIDEKGDKATAAEVNEEVARLAFSNPVEVHPLLPTAHERWASDSLGELAWALLEAWLDAGGEAKHQWALHAVGFWGDDEAASRLTRLAKAWPGQGHGKRAQWAIEALANIGSDAALANINLLAEKSRFPAFKRAAALQIEDVAASRGLTAAELADRLVPTLDLDDENAAVLDYGDRTFAVIFDESLSPVLRDENGKVHKNPPKPRKSDDETRAKAEIKRFKALKKEAKTAAALQITRMERTMQDQRPIAAGVFRTYFVEHPWMTHLTQRLVWCLADEPATTFRVVEDRTFATADEEPFDLPADAFVTVAHALHFAAGESHAWGAVFADYELAQPFEQIGRQVFVPSQEERDAGELVRFRGRTANFNQLRGLEGDRWLRWMDDSWINGMAREPVPHIEAVLFFEPGWTPGDFADDIDEQKLENVELYGPDEPTFGELPAVAFSELVLAIERALV